jgi:hypothetical protein
MDGYVATQAWAQKYLKTGAAFVRAIQDADVMLEFGALSTRYSAEVENGALIRSMIN